MQDFDWYRKTDKCINYIGGSLLSNLGKEMDAVIDELRLFREKGESWVGKRSQANAVL